MSDSFPDEVPVADAVEQAAELTPDEDQTAVAGGAPLETSESDWYEQQLVVADPEDDFR